MTSKRLGMSGSNSAPVESIMRGSLIWKVLGIAGRLPLAMMHFSKRMVSGFSPVIVTVLVSANSACPRIVSTPRPLQSCAMPPVSLPTTFVCT